MAPSAPINVTVFGRHYGVDDYLVIWSGEVRSVSWPALDRCSLICSPFSQRMESEGLRLGWERNCPYALYSSRCGVNRDLYQVLASVAAMDGAQINHPAFATYAEGYFRAGFVEWAISSSGEWNRRAIEAHSGDTLTLLGGTDGLSVGRSVRVYPGCAQTTDACQAFANLPNYGGIPHLAGESPFDNHPF